jgi:hypothetical protein
LQRAEKDCGLHDAFLMRFLRRSMRLRDLTRLIFAAKGSSSFNACVSGVGLGT